MAQARHGTGFWRSARRLPGRIPLRTKLITAVLALVAIALLIISIAGIVILRDTLLGPIDGNLTSQFDAAARFVNRSLQAPQGLAATEAGVAVDWIPANGSVHSVIKPTTAVGTLSGLNPPPPMPGPAIQSNPTWIQANAGHPFTVPAQSGGGSWRVYMESGSLPDGAQGTVVLAIDATSVYTTISRLTRIDLLVSVGVLCILAIIVIGLIRASLRPLKEIEETAGAIAAGDLTQRVPERDPRTEVGRLGRSLNIMLGQIETAFRQRSESARAARRSEERMRQFVTDASHELRTPLTAIRGFAEFYRQRGGLAASTPDQPGEPDVQAAVAEPSGSDTGLWSPRVPNGQASLEPSDLNRIMRRVEQESARMGILVEDMLLLARLDQQRPLERRPVDLLTLAADAVHDARVVAPDRSINLTVTSDAAPILVGDEVRLRQVIGNLMNNALTHTPDGTPIEVRLRSGTLDKPGSGGFTAVGADPQAVKVPAAVLEVADSGPGMTAEQAEHAFERFYRADQARSTGGTGLGLAIVAALVTAHGGTVWVDTEPGEGATFAIALPLAPEVVADAEDHAAEPDGSDVPDDRARAADNTAASTMNATEV